MVASVWFQFLPLVQSFLSPLKAGGEGGYTHIYIQSHFYYSTGVEMNLPSFVNTLIVCLLTLIIPIITIIPITPDIY